MATKTKWRILQIFLGNMLCSGTDKLSASNIQTFTVRTSHCKQGASLNEQEPLFDEQEPLFDEQEPLFDEQEALFDEQGLSLCKQEGIFSTNTPLSGKNFKKKLLTRLCL